MVPALIAAAGTIAGSLVSASAGKRRDAIQYQRQQELNKENNKFNAQEAAKQRAAAAALQSDQQRYNSEQAQVSRLRQAGLNPALLYGGATSSAGVNSASAASASPSSYTPTGTQLDLSNVVPNAMDAMLQSAQVENTRTNTASQAEDVVSKQINNKYIDTKTNIELMKMLQEYENLKKAGILSDKEIQWYDQTKSAVLDQIRGQIDLWTKQGEKMAAETTFIQDTQTPNVESETELNKAKTKTEGTVQDLNIAKAETEKTIQDLNISAEQRNYAEKALAQSQIKNNTAVRNEILRKYGLDKSESDLIEKALEKVGLSKGWTNTVLDVFGEFRRETGKGLGEFFSGDNWINFLVRKYGFDKDFEIGKQRNENDRYRTDEWKKTDDNGIKQQTPENIENDKKMSQGAPKDAVQTVPSSQAFNQELSRKWQYLNNVQQGQLNAIIKEQYPKWNKEKQNQFRKDLYYARTSKEINTIIHNYFNK